MREKKEKKKWGTIMFLIFIMVGLTSSFVFFGFSPTSNKVKYNDLTFRTNGNVWVAQINGVNAAFSFLPTDVEGIFAFDDFSSLLQNKFEIDATYDFNSSFREPIALAHYQMGLTLNSYNIFLRQGFTANNTFNMPIITCDDATSNVPVVYFKYGNTTNIHLEGSCVIAEASTNADFIRLKDRLLYGILGVIK
ncbi:hypothetical protein CMO83_01210 [Candidatus Woesearchaeota archaeon]|jgi:hypothetical protein|nr:hypothetical protein [Candidatus Woesearchaeota archaeon]|tara:strand:+ start:15446 stop:16024 length:579 start_codon:yes stop_codon:yes gene_type:complete